jgi:hypothetical protein
MVDQPFELTDVHQMVNRVGRAVLVTVLGLAHDGSRSHGTVTVFDENDPKRGFVTPGRELLLIVTRDDWCLDRYEDENIAWREASPEAKSARYANRVPKDVLLGPEMIHATAAVDVKVAFRGSPDGSGACTAVGRTVTFARDEQIQSVLVPLPAQGSPAFAFVTLVNPRWLTTGDYRIQAGITGMMPDCPTFVHEAPTESEEYARLTAAPATEDGSDDAPLDVEALRAMIASSEAEAAEDLPAPLVVRSGALVLTLDG